MAKSMARYGEHREKRAKFEHQLGMHFGHWQASKLLLRERLVARTLQIKGNLSCWGKRPMTENKLSVSILRELLALQHLARVTCSPIPSADQNCFDCKRRFERQIRINHRRQRPQKRYNRVAFKTPSPVRRTSEPPTIPPRNFSPLFFDGRIMQRIDKTSPDQVIMGLVETKDQAHIPRTLAAHRATRKAA